MKNARKMVAGGKGSSRETKREKRSGDRLIELEQRYGRLIGLGLHAT